jgi:chromosome segregation ATPase
LIESGMFFVLGLATAGLLALMIAPVLWRRAVRLTRAKIEHAVPANLAEIQADKDQLRAEFAMAARRLETTVESLRQKAGEQLVDINQKRDLIRRLAEEQARRVEVLEKLEERESELHNLLHRREDRIAETTAELGTLRHTLAERSRALEQIEATLKRAAAANEEQTVELVAKGTEIENLRDHLASAKSRQTALQIERTKLQTELAEAQSAKAAAAQQLETVQRRLAAAEKEQLARVADIDARDREIERMQGVAADKAKTYAELEQRLVESEAANADTAAKISQMALEIDELSRREPSEELQHAMARLESERDALAAELAALQDQHAKLASENAELQRIAGDDWEAERIQNAMLRERLNDIAGEVSRLTHSYQEDMGLPELTALAGGEANGGGKKSPGRRRSSPRRTRSPQRAAQNG